MKSQLAITEQFTSDKFLYTSFAEYAEIMGIKKTHPNWDAFQLVWNMARTPNFSKKSCPDCEPKRDYECGPCYRRRVGGET